MRPTGSAAELEARRRRAAACIVFEQLPAYCQELNLVEAMWSHGKYGDLANFVPNDIDHLQTAVDASLIDQSQDHCLKIFFFKTAQLRL